MAFSGHRPTSFGNADGRPETINTERYQALMGTKFIPEIRWFIPEVRSLDEHGYCDLSVGWRNIALLQCFTRTPSPILPWRLAHLPLYGPPLVYTFCGPITFRWFSLGIPTVKKQRLCWQFSNLLLRSRKHSKGGQENSPWEVGQGTKQT